MTSDLREEGARRDILLPRGARHMQATPEAPPLEIELFTDPACPFAFSAEPIRQRLRWHYGDGLNWTVRMIVLTREPGEAEKLAGGAPGLQRRYGMPIDPRPYARPASCEPACLAFVAARRHAPQRAQALLRRLRVRVMQRGLLDDPALIDAAARDAGLDPSRLRAWCAEPETLLALEADAAAARSPSPAARALPHKLGGPARERRYTAPSYIIGGFALPGFHPAETYEAAISNLAPDLPRRPPPKSILDVLEWSEEPLASAELALIVGLEPDQVRAELRGEARFEPAGADGYWSL